MSNSDTAPVAFFAFNRPTHTRLTLAALTANELATYTDLHIFCDAPRTKTDEKAVEQVREICRNATGFASVCVHERSVNQGLANSLFAGLDFMFEKYERVIVFEDDILASPKTLRFLNTCLTRYQSEPVVFSISAWSPDPKKMDFPDDYPWDVYFIPRFHCWGWASWKDRWRSVDRNVLTAPAIFDNPHALRVYSQSGKDMPGMLRLVLSGELDTWDIQTDFARFAHGRLGVNPLHAYTENIGFDAAGTHTTCAIPRFAVDTSLAPAIAKLPEYIFVDDVIIDKYKNFFSGSDDDSSEDNKTQLLYINNRIDDIRDRVYANEVELTNQVEALRQQLNTLRWKLRHPIQWFFRKLFFKW